MAGLNKFAIVARQFSTSISAQAKLIPVPTAVSGIEGRYAHALFSAASKNKKLEAVERDMIKIAGFMETDAKFAAFVINPAIRRVVKKNAIETVLRKQNCDEVTVNLFACLAENGRLKNVKNVFVNYDRIMAAYRGEVKCVITTAKPLDAAMMKQLEKTLMKFLKKGENIKIVTKVNPSIVGGMVVNIGDRYVDMSMASKINTYTNLIKQSV